MPASREICKICYHIISVGFVVPNEIWQAVVPHRHQGDEICLGCFTRLADEKLIDWDSDIKFYPVSLKSHLEDIE